MYISVFLFFLISIFSSSVAIFSDEAYNVDFHYALLGRPIQQSTFFHQPNPVSKASLIYTVTDRSILGVINPKDGNIVWRQQLSGCEDNKCLLRAGEGQDTIISADGKGVSAWNAADGRLVWRSSVPGHTIEDLKVLDFPNVGKESVAKDALVLYNGLRPAVHRLSGESGETLWVYNDESEDSVYQLSTSATAIYLISLHSTILGGTKIRITQLDPVDGRKIDQYNLGAESEIASRASIHFVGANAASPILAWTDKPSKNLKVHIIGSKHTSSFQIPSSVGSNNVKIALHAPYKTKSLSHFLVSYEDGTQHWAEVYHVDPQKNSISKSFEVPKVPGKGVFSTSTVDATVYFTRFAATEVSIISSASSKGVERWSIIDKTTSRLSDRWDPSHATSEVVSKAGSGLAIRSAVLLSSGDWILIRNGVIEWARPEALAQASVAVWADYPAQEDLAEQVVIESHQTYTRAYFHRLRRHLENLNAVPQLATKLYRRVISTISGSNQRMMDLERSLFGFHKLIIFATGNGQLIALNTGLGDNIEWKADFAKYNISSIWSEISMRNMPGGLIELRVDDTIRYLSAATGEHFQLPDEIKRLGSDHSVVGLKPLVSYVYSEDRVVGELLEQDLNPLWSFIAPAGESILSVESRPLEDPVASIGRVLGDRRVLYKYLNANLALIVTANKSSRLLSAYLIDSVSGNVLYTSRHSDVDISRPITSMLSENWIAYSFTAVHPPTDSRGPTLVVADLYESSLPNDRGPLGGASNFSAFEVLSALGDAAKPYVVSQTYLIPEEISKMSVSHTRQGISTRQLLVALPQSSAIVGIPRSVLDPRRPVGRDPTKIEMAEGLSRYSPYLNLDPRWFLSHRRSVMGIENIQSTPSGLESTSIVVAFGLDVFGTRVSPSHSFDRLGKDFNKVQMLGTVFALFIALIFIGPIVNRKKINTLWRNS